MPIKRTKSIDLLVSLLEKSGEFDKLEIKVLKAMLELEKEKKIRNTASEIAKKSKLSVTNAYKYLYSLQEKGIVESSKSNKGRANKIFWLTRSFNPFPRILSYVKMKFLEKKKMFEEMEKLYEDIIPIENVWFGEKYIDHYTGKFADRASFLIDLAKDEILITTKKFWNDFILLDAIKRAIERGVRIRIIAEELDPNVVNDLKKIGIEMRLGVGWPYVILVDKYHGLTVDENENGIWFLNHANEFKEKFEDFWKNADEI